jgi:hypothetical protein
MHACTNQVCVAVDSAKFANLGTNCTYVRDGTAKFELILSSLPGSAPIQEARQAGFHRMSLLSGKVRGFMDWVGGGGGGGVLTAV